MKQLLSSHCSIAESKGFGELSAAQRKIIENDLRDFKLSGVHLPPDKKARLAELEQQLSQLTTTFSENIIRCTQ